MPSTIVHKKHAALTANGGADGLVTVADNSGWLPGSTVWLSSSTQEGLQCIVSQLVGTTQIRLRKADAPAPGAANVSAYLLADGAKISMESQVVPVRDPFEPRERA